MLRLITRKKALEFYQMGYKVVISGSEKNPEENSEDCLYVCKEEHPFFPERRVEAMKARFGQLWYWVCCVEASLGWNGQQYVVREKKSGKVLHRIKGRESSVIRFAKSMAISIANPGFLPSQFKHKLA